MLDPRHIPEDLGQGNGQLVPRIYFSLIRTIIILYLVSLVIFRQKAVIRILVVYPKSYQ